MSNNFKFGRRSKGFLYGTDDHPGVKEATQRLCVAALKETTVDFGVIDGFRTTEQQQAIYAKGNSELDGVINKSYHQSGYAVDVIPVVIDKNTGERLNPWDVEIDQVKVAWFEVGRAFLRAAFKLNLDVTWGVAFNISGGRDYPHFQIKFKD